MAVRLAFHWWANSLLTFVMVGQLLLVALGAWAGASIFGTKVLAWIFADARIAERKIS